jgi:hypothetical protein
MFVSKLSGCPLCLEIALVAPIQEKIVRSFGLKIYNQTESHIHQKISDLSLTYFAARSISFLVSTALCTVSLMSYGIIFWGNLVSSKTIPFAVENNLNYCCCSEE